MPFHFGKKKKHGPQYKTKKQAKKMEGIRDQYSASKQALENYRKAQGEKGGSEYFVDWGKIPKQAAGQKEGFMQLRANDGSWRDVRITLHSTYLSISKIESETLLLSELVHRRHMEGERDVVIHKKRGEPLGFAIKGGKEYGIPLLISQIKEGGPVDSSCGCYIGDELLMVNGYNVESLTQIQAIEVLRDQLEEKIVSLSLRHYPAANTELVQAYLRSSDPTLHISKEKKWKEVMKIPLAYCNVSKYESGSSKLRPNQSFIVSASMDVSRKAILRPPYGKIQERDAWIKAIQIARDFLPTPSLLKPDPPLEFSGRVAHIGRVYLRSENGTWHDLFLCVTDHDISLYTSAPTSPEDLALPSATFPLLACRFFPGVRTLNSIDEHDGRESVEGMFSLNIPFTQYYLGAGSNIMSLQWQNIVELRTDNAVRKMGSITYAAEYNEEDVSLTINWQSGVWLNHDVKGDKSLIFHHPFANLISMQAENKRTLRCEFAHGQEDIHLDNAELVKFVLTNFLACHARTKEGLKSTTIV